MPDRLANWEEVCNRTGVTYRQLSYWIEIGAVWPHEPAHGAGTVVRFDEADVAWVRVLGQASRLGVAPGTLVAQVRRDGTRRYGQRLRWLAVALDRDTPAWLLTPVESQT